MSDHGQLKNRVQGLRGERGWSQAELAQRAGISRAAVSAIEIHRLVPSVAAALALATAFGCRVEDLFGAAAGDVENCAWAWPPAQEPCRFWHARVGCRVLLFPAEPTAAGVVAHDGVFQHGETSPSADTRPENTLVMASCDPAAALLANEYARTSGFRLLVLHRASRQALDLLRAGLVEVAGIHLTTRANDDGNAAAARSVLGTGYTLFTAASWQEGLAVASGVAATSLRSLVRAPLRWIGREPGSGARQCQDELLHDRPSPRRFARDHRGVAEAIRCGWADIGVCVRLVCDEAGLKFIKVRDETYDLCFRTDQESDPRLRALLRVLRSPSFRAWLSELPGYDCRFTGETVQLR